MDQLDFQVNDKYLQMFPMYCDDENEHYNEMAGKREGQHYDQSRKYVQHDQLNFGRDENLKSRELLFREGEPIYITKGVNSVVDSAKQTHFPSAVVKRKKLESSLPEKENNRKRGNSGKPLFKKPKKAQKKRKSLSKEKAAVPSYWNADVKSTGLFDPRIQKNQLRNEEFIMDLVARDTRKATNNKAEQIKKASPKFETYQNIYEIQNMLDEENQKKLVKMKEMQEREIKELKKRVEEEEKRKIAVEKKYQEKYKKLEMQRNVQLEVSKKIKHVKEAEQNLVRGSKKSVLEKTENDLKKGKLDSEQILGAGGPPIQQFPNEDKIGIDAETWKNTLDLLQYNALKQQDEFDEDNKSEVDMIPTRDGGSRKKGKGKRSRSKNRNKDVQYRELFANTEAKAQKNLDYELELRQMELKEFERQKELDRLIEEHKRKMTGQPEPNEEYARIEGKLKNIRTNLEPLIKSLKKKKTTSRAFPFTGNLLARASAKLIQTYAEDLTERVLDDLLIEVVIILNEEEAKEKEKEKAVKRKALFLDYTEAFKELEYEQEQIKHNLKYKEKHPNKGANERPFRELEFYHGIGAEKSKFKVIELSLGQIDSIFLNKARFFKDFREDENNSKDSLLGFDHITREIVDEIYDEVYEDIDRMQDEFVEMVFKQEFV